MKTNRIIFAMFIVFSSVVAAQHQNTSDIFSSKMLHGRQVAPVAEVSKFAALKTQAAQLGAKVSAKIAQHSLNAKALGLSGLVAAAVLSPFVYFDKSAQQQAPKTMLEKAQDKFNDVVAYTKDSLNNAVASTKTGVNNAVSYINTQANSAKNSAIAHPYMTSGALTAVVVAGAAYAYTQAEDQN